jgi:cytidine deaminase
MISGEQQATLMDLAEEARAHSYSPYSHYAVGAALLCQDGSVYQGCNIENASYTPTICAERNAFFKAIFDGQRSFTAIAVIGSGETPAYPCGVCRQVMAEFCDGDFTIVTANRDRTVVFPQTLSELLPHSFGPKDLV